MIILEGIVGSTAYGMATADSDEDRLGIFVAPTAEIVGLDWNNHKESIVRHEPDQTLHEIGKFCRLALQCNPTVTELLWLESYTTLTYTGVDLVALQGKFLSTKSVAARYGGYAKSQVERLRRRGDGSFSSDTRKRTAKHARHCYRLLIQGSDLMIEGILPVKLDPATRDRCFELGELAVSDLDKFYEWWEVADESFKKAAANSILPDEPDREAVNDFLISLRKEHF